MNVLVYKSSVFFMPFYKKKKNFSGSRYAIDLKTLNLSENGSLHSPSSLIFTFRFKFLFSKRKQLTNIIQTLLLK